MARSIRRAALALTLTGVLAAGSGLAQHSPAQHSPAQHSPAQHSPAQHSPAQHSSAQHAQPYAALASRQIKALSEQQVADLKAGRGMGLALAAELNGYPGPLHVLELAGPLTLSDGQRARMAEIVSAMKAETMPLGERLVEAEAELDKLFSGRLVTETSLVEVTTTIGRLQAALRAAHLKHHLTTVAALHPDQVSRYGELRGYGLAAPHHNRQN
jgi:hypothetical protein